MCVGALEEADRLSCQILHVLRRGRLCHHDGGCLNEHGRSGDDDPRQVLLDDFRRIEEKHIVTAVAHAIIGVGRVVLVEFETAFGPEHGGTDGAADIEKKPGRHAIGPDRDHAWPRFPAAPDDPGLPHLVEHAAGVQGGSVCGNEYQDHPRTQARHTQARHRRFPSV